MVASPRQANACSPPPDGWFFAYEAGATPVNGVMVLSYGCYTSCDPEPDLETFVLKTAAGEAIAGSVVLSGTSNSLHFLAFRPENPLVIGEAYTAELEGVAPFPYLTVAPEITWKTDFTVTDEFVEIDQPHGETICCTGPLDSCGGTPCFRTEVDRKITTHVTWEDGQTAESTQYAYRILRDGDESNVPWSWNGASAAFELGATETSVCYTLELQRLSDGFVHRFDERCIERPEEFEPGIYPTPEQTITTILASCEAPPDGYKSQWCGVRADLCLPNDDPWCENYVEICLADGGAGGTPNVGGSSGTSGSAGSSSGSGGSGAQGGSAGSGGAGSGGTQAGTGGTDEGDAGETSEGGGERVLTKGCGCAVPGTGTSGRGALAFTMLGLAALGLRRRRSA